MPGPPSAQHEVPVAIEAATSRVFASALDWPGWSRGARDEASALDALFAYGPRYRRALKPTRLNVPAPAGAAAFRVAERLKGDATTNFGTPGTPPSADLRPLDADELQRQLAILGACWGAFTAAVESAKGKELRKGPRGGGRDVDKMTEHVLGAHQAYLRQISCREPFEEGRNLRALLPAIKETDARALAFALSPEMPRTGPRGGTLWKPRYFVRRAAWHILDHAWEIEDRLEP